MNIIYTDKLALWLWWDDWSLGFRKGLSGAWWLEVGPVQVRVG